MFKKILQDMVEFNLFRIYFFYWNSEFQFTIFELCFFIDGKNYERSLFNFRIKEKIYIDFLFAKVIGYE